MNDPRVRSRGWAHKARGEPRGRGLPGRRGRLETGLGTEVVSSYRPPVITFLRFVGVMNAAVWLGGSAFHLLAVAPFFATPAVRWVLGDVHATGAGLMLWQRFYVLQYTCLTVSFLHHIAEWVYIGRPISRATGWMLGTLLVLALLGNLELDRAVVPAHWARGNPRATPEDRARAERGYPLWSTLWLSTNGALGLVVLVFSWRVLTASHGPRFVTQTKFRTPDSLDP